jgi:hypothetical protein
VKATSVDEGGARRGHNGERADKDIDRVGGGGEGTYKDGGDGGKR